MGDTLGALIRRQAEARPDQPLLICDDDRLTYGAADSQSAMLAARLITLGAGLGTRVGVLHPNGSRFVVAALAAARIGAVVVPFSTFLTARELSEQLRHCDAEIVLSATSFRTHDYRRRLAEALGEEPTVPLFCPQVPQLRHVLFDDDSAVPGVDERFREAVEADVVGSDVMAVIYTSGSTGTPKGVVHTHEALLRHQHSLNVIRRFTENDRLFCNSPFFWIGGFAFALLATIDTGATLLCSITEDTGRTLDLLEAEKPTLTNGFAAGIAHLAEHPSFQGRDLSTIRRGNLYPLMAPHARPADPERRHNMLGLTEGGSVVLISADDTEQPPSRRGSFGRPAPGVTIRVVDPDTGADAQDLGELWLRGPNLMQHYHRRSREESFDADGWFHTGDLVRVDDDDFVYYAGRRDALIKTAGANVAPAEVAAAISRVTGGLMAHVVGLPDPDRGEIVAAVVAGDPDTFDESHVRALLKSELSAYKIPRRFVVLNPVDIPLLSSGKVNLAAVRSVFDA